MRCTECNKVYRGGKGWKISQGFYSMYASCPKHSKDNPQKESYKDLRIQECAGFLYSAEHEMM